jgi:hypothetical protein
MAAFRIYEGPASHAQGFWVTGFDKDAEASGSASPLGFVLQPLEERLLQICCRCSIG